MIPLSLVVLGSFAMIGAAGAGFARRSPRVFGGVGCLLSGLFANLGAAAGVGAAATFVSDVLGAVCAILAVLAAVVAAGGMRPWQAWRTIPIALVASGCLLRPPGPFSILGVGSQLPSQFALLTYSSDSPQ